MSAGFIPMVSNTPPPIDDDHEEDLMDSIDKEDEFGEIQSYSMDNFSFSPINSSLPDSKFGSHSSLPDSHDWSQFQDVSEGENILPESNTSENVDDKTVPDDYKLPAISDLSTDKNYPGQINSDERIDGGPNCFNNGSDDENFECLEKRDNIGNQPDRSNNVTVGDEMEITSSCDRINLESAESLSKDKTDETILEDLEKCTEPTVSSDNEFSEFTSTEHFEPANIEFSSNTIPSENIDCTIPEVSDDSDFGCFENSNANSEDEKFSNSKSGEHISETEAEELKDSDCDDGFANFSTSHSESKEIKPCDNSTSLPLGSNETTNFGSASDDEEDQFGGFANFSTADIQNSEKSAENRQNDAEFCDFEGDEDFAEFGSESDFSWATSEPIMLTRQEKVDNYMCNYANKKQKISDECSVFLLDERIHTNMLEENYELNSHHTPMTSFEITCPGDLWNFLEDIDNTIALNFAWNGSTHNIFLLEALGMPTKNFLFSGEKQAYYVPTYYAAGLDLLDPTRGILKPMSAAEKITALSPSEKNSTASVQEEMTATKEPPPQWKSVAELHGRKSGTINHSCSSSSDILQLMSKSPINNLDAPQSPIEKQGPPPMDFSSLPSIHTIEKSTGNSNLIDPELLEFTSSPSTEPALTPKESGNATLSKILASLKGSTMSNISPVNIKNDPRWNEEEAKLSAEARNVLEKLPDLSYMRSKVLMFPINMSRVNMDNDV